MAKNRNFKSLTKQDQVKLVKHPPPPSPPDQKPPAADSSSWAIIVRTLSTCKHIQLQQKKVPNKALQQNVQQNMLKVQPPMKENSKNKSKSKSKKVMCSGSLCNSTKVMHKPAAAEPPSPQAKKKKKKKKKLQRSLSKDNDLNAPAVSSNYTASPFKGSMPFMKLSGCYECRLVVDPVIGFTKDTSLRRPTLSSCNVCGEIFIKPDYLELHQATRHAVSELGPEDTSKKIVEMIFKSSWSSEEHPVCKIDRILKVHNTPKTLARFEEYRDHIKAKANKQLAKKHSRCMADGNELLRFHCTSFMCSLGLGGSSNLCNSIPNCGVCSIIKGGFRTDDNYVGKGKGKGKGILTTASSGKAHEIENAGGNDQKRAMLVCRVIAGRVKNNLDGSLEEYDSVAGVYSNSDDLFVFNPRAILPCFVVIYQGC